MPQGRTRRGSAAAFLHQSAKHVRQKDAPFQRQQTVVEIDSRSSRRHAHDQGNAEGYFVTTVKMSEMAVEKSCEFRTRNVFITTYACAISMEQLIKDMIFTILRG